MQDTPEESAVKDDDPPVKSDAEQQQQPVESFVPNVDSHLTGNIICDSTINDDIFNANEQPEDDDEIIVVCSPPRKQDKSDSPPCSPPTLPEAESSEHDAQISLKSDVAEQREADAAAEAQAAAEADSEPVQEIDVVNDNPPNDHDQVQKLNDFDSAKAVNRYILQTNNTSSSSNIIHNSSNHINNENINDATAPAALNEDIIDDANGTNAATADNISHDASGIAQADKHTASATNNNNNYQQQQSNATAVAAAAATGASVESVEYATLAATDLCGGTLTVQGVDSEQSENFVVTSGYIQECGY